jgi:GH15 family glucan-1,4-alpha-glucosidase
MTSWLVDALCLIGDYERAGDLFKDLCSLAGHTGLLTEQFDPESGRALGNVPQAYSHLGLINNALALDGNL